MNYFPNGRSNVVLCLMRYYERKTKDSLVLATEREQLIALTKRRKTAQALALRARIVLACAEGLDNKVVAARLRVTQQTVSSGGAVLLNFACMVYWMPHAPGAPRTIER